MPDPKTSFTNQSMPNIWTSKGKLYMGDTEHGLPEEEVVALQTAQKAYIAKVRENSGANRRPRRKA